MRVNAQRAALKVRLDLDYAFWLMIGRLYYVSICLQEEAFAHSTTALIISDHRCGPGSFVLTLWALRKEMVAALVDLGILDRMALFKHRCDECER